MNTVKQLSDTLNPAQRIGELLIAFALLLLMGFFVIHQSTNTSFFTSKFGALEAFLLYAPLLLAIAAAVIQALIGHQNPGRPVEALSNLLLGIAALWFLIAFPFDFAHLADALPPGLRFTLAWMTNDIGKIPLFIQLFVGPATAMLTMRNYLSYTG